MAHADPTEAELNRNVRIGSVVHAENNGQRRNPFAPLLPKFAVTLFIRQGTAKCRTPGNAPIFTVFCRLSANQPGIGPGTKSSGRTQLGKAVHRAGQRPTKNAIDIKVRAADKGNGQWTGNVVSTQKVDSRFTRQQARKKIRQIATIGTDQAQPGNRNPPLAHGSALFAA